MAHDITDATLEKLVTHARRVSEHAYSPYSQFRVGAAIVTDDGEIFSGCNVENASYGLTICAERNAVFQMISKAHRKIVAMAVYTPTTEPVTPCGACRQVINEFGADALIICVCDAPQVLRMKMSELLPNAFGPANLNTKCEASNE